MKTIKVEFPADEALEVIRLLRAESRCLIENGDLLTDRDVAKRAQTALSARERIVSALEVFAEAPPEAKAPAITAGPMYRHQPSPTYRSPITTGRSVFTSKEEDDWLMEQGTTLPKDRQSLAVVHGVVEEEEEISTQSIMNFTQGIFRGRGGVSGSGTG